MLLPEDVHETLCVCSLRFDGNRWLETRHPDKEPTDFRAYVEPVVATLRLHDDEEANFAVCFALQRFLCKWGGEMLPPESREHVAWRYLFLHLHTLKVPERFRQPEYVDRWDRDHADVAAAHAALVREALLVNGPGHDVPVTLDNTRFLGTAGIEIASWSLVAELVCRAPERLQVIETHPGGGIYDCLALLDGSRTLSHLNRSGSLHVAGRLDSQPGVSVSLEVWTQLASGENPRTILDEWSRHLGLIVPKTLPVGSPVSLTYRVMAAALKQAAFSPHEWRWVNRFHDTSGWTGGVREEHFARFPDVARRQKVALHDDVLGQPAYRFWFLEQDQVPIACVETNGTVWRNKTTVDLPAEYRRHRNINALAALVTN